MITSERLLRYKKQREQSQPPCLTDGDPDRISFLPGQLSDRILSLVPIKDAVRTSILSSKWRYRWATLPNLVFDNECLFVAPQDPNSIIRDKLPRIIDHVLLLHSGPINKFKLSHRDFRATADIDKWILHLSHTSIKKLVLEIWRGQRYTIPSSLFACQSLFHLELLHCVLNPPPSTFQGFRNLKSLDVQQITLTQDVFENLISSCPLLERLTLINYDGFSHLNIDVPNLQYLDFGGNFEDVSFENTFRLAVVSIDLFDLENSQGTLPGTSSNLLNFFVNLPHLRRLEIQSYFLKYLVAGIVPLNLPRPCIDLTYLSLRLNFHDPKEISAALCLLRSSPNLQELEMLVRPEEQNDLSTHNDSWEDGFWDCPVLKLQRVRIDGIIGIKPELDFISFLLLEAPMLEVMTVKPVLPAGMELIKELMRFRRVSKRAELIYVDKS